ncbi:hypothetical protein B0H41_004487 [Clostridium beijerinckii]|uniref:Uncharacterized protein n=1 Tax=Clostridium beijerinckii TaxID=1520 RepID=A0AAX0B6I2_CLOBE|nr:hypothetical protein [Clostridium beijerinckii]
MREERDILENVCHSQKTFQINYVSGLPNNYLYRKIYATENLNFFVAYILSLNYAADTCQFFDA